MKRKKNNKMPPQVSKISDFFPKAPIENEHVENKRKREPLSPNSVTLNSAINLPQKYEKPSPEHKKIKQDENCINLIRDDCTSNSCVSVHNNFQVATPEKWMRPSSSMRTPSSKKSGGSSKNRTPQSCKKATPKKLFEKSPRKLEEFNVQILETFLQVSPSTSNEKIRIQQTPGKVYTQSPVMKTIRKTPKHAFTLSSNKTSPLKSPRGSPLKTAKPKTKLCFLDSIDALHTKEGMEEAMQTSKTTKFEFDDFFEDEYALLKLEDEFKTLNLETPQHCKVVNVQKNDSIIVLELKSTKDKSRVKCNVEQFWACSNSFKSGDTVYICAEKIDNKWVINNEKGWLVFEPDFLISCTSVVGSLFCKRKAIFADRFRGFDPNNRIMTIGVLTHTLLQQSLKKKLKTTEEIKILLKTILGAKDTMKRLYENNLRIDEIESELEGFVPKLVTFISEYVTCESTPNPANWQGQICDIDDIEENLWCQESGTKGKIDVSVQTQTGVMPLELKTGRATVSMEHRGQVVLYIMMMNKFGYQVSSGLLLYLREGVLKEIKATPQEKRDVLILRNELAYFLLKHVATDVKRAPELPEPLNHRGCNKCSYNTICTSYLKHEDYDIAKNKSIQEVQTTATAHLTQSHIDYFLLWCNLLGMEEDSNKLWKSVEQIYTVSPVNREASGRCIINLKVTNIAAEQNGLYEHTFQKEDRNFNLIASEIVENNYVIVSTNARPAVATGFVTQISALKISVLLDRNLNKKYEKQLFHLDTYDSKITYTFNMSSLALLLENTKRAAELRDIIIDKKLPTFESKLPALVAKKGATILRRLNLIQQKAVLKALCANDFLLIKGMPGTGKSATIVALIQVLVELDKSILLTSHTHSAIDNICIRLQKRKVDFLRLGSESKIDPLLRSNTEATLLKNCTTPQEIEEIYNKYKVVAVTCLGSGHSLLSRRVFDVCIVDESTQVVQTSVIRPLLAAKTFVLIGDPNQLAPVVKNVNALQAGMSESLFARLEKAEGTITLNLNYRMNQTITNLANILTYNGELQTANKEVSNRTLKIPNLEEVQMCYQNHSWLLKTLDTSLEAAVQLIDTGPVWEQPIDIKWHLQNAKMTNSDSSNCINVHEIAIVVTLVKALIKGGVENDEIGVIATYRAQVAQISNFLGSLNVDVSTVDQFQGRDKSVIVFSCTKSTNTSSTDALKFELLEDKRRLTVAMTRAKRKVLIVGDVGTLQRFSTFSKIIPALKNHIIKFDSSWSLVNNF